MADREKAARLYAHLKVAMAQAQIGSMFQLAQRAHVTEHTLENWVYGRTEPRLREMSRVAEALAPYTTLSEMQRAYEGLAPSEPPLVEQIALLLPELRELVVLMRARADQEVLEAVREELDRRRREPPRPPDEQPSDRDAS